MKMSRSLTIAAAVISGLLAGTWPQVALASSRPHSQPLELNVYTAGEKQFYVNATFVHGRTEGLLIDTQFDEDAVRKLMDEVAATGLRLKAIFITHPDSDHYGGIAAFKRRFPDTPIYMTRRGAEEFRRTVDSSKQLEMPEPLPTAQMSIDGHAIKFIEDLQGDYPAIAANTPVWIPSLRTILADDVVFRGVHPWLTDSTPRSRAEWRKALLRLKSLRAKRLIPGHQHGFGSNSPADDLEFMDRYIRAFGQVAKTAPDALAFIKEMERRFPGLAVPGLLEHGAKSVYAKSP